jgi:hypothetical protein
MMTIATTGAAVEAELAETGEKRDALGRRRAQLLAAYRASGLTQRAFAERERINYTTFCTWAQAERRRGRLPVAPAGRKPRAAQRVGGPFVEVQLASAAPPPASETGLEIRLADGTLLRGSSASELAKLARALRA